MLLPCNSTAKQKSYENGNGRRGCPPTPIFKSLVSFFSSTSDFYFESRFIILSLSLTTLDDGVFHFFSCPPLAI